LRFTPDPNQKRRILPESSPALRFHAGMDLRSAGPEAILDWGPHAGVTWLVACLQAWKCALFMCSSPSKIYPLCADFGSRIGSDLAGRRFCLHRYLTLMLTVVRRISKRKWN